MRLALAFFMALAVACAACGGGESSLSTPAAPTPVPAAPSAPNYANMVGGWEGTVSFNQSSPAGGSAASCRQTWVVTSQNQGSFLGTFQTAPPVGTTTTTTCTQSGSVEGVIAPSGAITDIVHSTVINPNGCMRTMRTAMVGVVTGSSLSAQTTEQRICSGVTVSVGISIALTKR